MNTKRSHHLHNNLILISLVLLVYSCASLRSVYNPKGMDYQLRRPVTYLYNRLAYKFDINPYTSHLLNTETECSSKTGPYCQFINKKKMMTSQLVFDTEGSQLQRALRVGAANSRQIAFQIQKGLLDVFLISSDSHKKYDSIIKQIIQKDFYQTSSQQTQQANKQKVKQQVFIKQGDQYVPLNVQ